LQCALTSESDLSACYAQAGAEIAEIAIYGWTLRIAEKGLDICMNIYDKSYIMRIKLKGLGSLHFLFT